MSQMEFSAASWITELDRSGRRLLALFAETPPEAWTATVEPGRWSLVEILAHLVDEEREDFRARVLSTLEDPEAEWPPIDPEGWVESRDYARRDPAELLGEFETERSESLRRLGALGDVDWSAAHEHPKLGRLRAGDLLCAWVAHDRLHAQQILRTRWQWMESASGPFDARYAAP
jgi:uncharacterized damage-inducible protein DinB